MAKANPRMPEIVESLNRLGRLTHRQERMLKLTEHFMEYFMRSLQEITADLKAENAKLRQLITDDQATDQQTFDTAQTALKASQKLNTDLAAEIENLKKQIEDGKTIDTTELESILEDSKSLESLITPLAEQPEQPELPPGETEVPPQEPGTASFR